MMLILYLMAFIDYIIYSMAAAMFRIIMDVANIEFFTEGQITGLTHRIYVVVGVLMLFKLVIAAIQYMINPDTFDDKDKGFGGILLRAAVSLGLIVIVPPLFAFAFKIQKPIVEAIPNIIFGTEQRVDFKDDKQGKNISFQVLSAFIPVREGHESKIASNQRINDLASFEKNATAGCPALSLFGAFGSMDDCHYNYIIIISTVAGIFMCYVLFVMITDVAIRSIKFSIIQILAPIPISSYIFSKDKLNKFVKAAVSVYLDLFIRMAVIYFVVFAIEKITEAGILKDLGQGDIFRYIIVHVAIILGLLMFAKNAPKFITDLLGLENVTSDDMKNMFARAGGLFGATLGAGKSYISSRANARAQALKDEGLTPDKLKGMDRKERRKAIKEAVGKYNDKQGWGHGVTGRALRAAASSYKTGAYQSYVKGKGYKETFDATDRAGQKSYELDKALVDNNQTHWDYNKEVIKRRMGINSDLDVMNAEIDAAKNASDKSKAALDLVHNQIGEKFGGIRFTDELMKDEKFLASLRVDVGVDNYTFGRGKNQIKLDLRSMGESGDHTIAGVMKDLETISENKNGVYSGDDVAKASRMLDKLQGEADKYIINMTKKLESELKKNPSLAENFDSTQYARLGFESKINPNFLKAIQEALEANIIHSGDTQYGREVWETAKSKGFLFQKADGSWDIKPDHYGDWIGLNKAMGQSAQTSNIAAKGTQASNAIIKNLADKYDKK
jgi:hypothetical protein